MLGLNGKAFTLKTGKRVFNVNDTLRGGVRVGVIENSGNGKRFLNKNQPCLLFQKKLYD